MAYGAGQSRISLAGVCMDAQAANMLDQFILATPGAVYVGNVERYVGAEREVARLLTEGQSRICLVDFDQNIDEALWFCERLRAENPEIFVFAISGSSDPERIITAMRAGCSEYLMKPLKIDRIQEGLVRVEGKQKERARSKLRGKMVTLVGAKGGTGVTSIALHLALALANGEKRRCLLIDQHPSMGDCSLYLGTGRHQYNFYELASNTDRLDDELLAGFLLSHSSGLDLLDSPERVDGQHSATPAAIEQTLTFLADTYDFLVVDCPPGLSGATVSTISQSDQVAIVMTPDLPSVRNAARYLEYLTKVGCTPTSIRIVLNRHAKRSPLSDERIEQALRHPINVRVPNSFAEVIRAINAGIPIQTEGRSDFASAIADWAAEFSGEGAAKAAGAAGGGGFLSLFGGKS